MSITLRITLIVVALLTLIFISKKVRGSKVQLEDSIFWICFAVIVFIVSLFPQIFYALSNLVGTESPVNFVFLFFIFTLLMQSFALSMRISRANTKIKELTQQLAIEKFERYMNDKRKKNYQELLGEQRIEENSETSNDTTQKPQA